MYGFWLYNSHRFHYFTLREVVFDFEVCSFCCLQSLTKYRENLTFILRLIQWFRKDSRWGIIYWRNNSKDCKSFYFGFGVNFVQLLRITYTTLISISFIETFEEASKEIEGSILNLKNVMLKKLLGFCSLC